MLALSADAPQFAGYFSLVKLFTLACALPRHVLGGATFNLAEEKDELLMSFSAQGVANRVAILVAR